MTRKDWEKIAAARVLLGLEEKATLADIKKAYRRMSKKHHPDLAESREGKQAAVAMHEITAAYQVLLRYCQNYRFPLVMQQDTLDPEDWWMDRFGQDPLWGKRDDDS
ncbi:MAG: J domain-containing protein [Desulfurivibrio sp.]|nr:MAG: J domain-containing protein [Desulfurivibrio sp.]